MSAFGVAVRTAREARGWKQSELAERCGVSQRAVSSWEHGVSEPCDDTKRIVAGVLTLPPEVIPAGYAMTTDGVLRPVDGRTVTYLGTDDAELHRRLDQARLDRQQAWLERWRARVGPPDPAATAWAYEVINRHFGAPGE